MFTGIVEEIGVVTAVNKTRIGLFLKIKAQGVSSGVKVGDSIAINGVCLSVTDIKDGIFSFDVMQETLKMTTLGELRLDELVNLERSLRLDSRIGGHFVSGHIDYTGRIQKVIKNSEGIGFEVSLPIEFSTLVARKGSIALDGVSLTIADIQKRAFTVYLIPHTLKVTTLGRKRKGDSLNVETDLLAKYVAKAMPKAGIETLLKKYDYI